MNYFLKWSKIVLAAIAVVVVVDCDKSDSLVTEQLPIKPDTEVITPEPTAVLDNDYSDIIALDFR